MHAIVVTRHGGPEVLELVEREMARAGPAEVLVEVAAAGVNYMDIYSREGTPPYRAEPPYVLGVEGAGTVAAVGAQVSGLAKGDRVAWTGVPGSYAERVLVPADRAVKVPDGVDLHVAAAVLLQGTTAHYLSHDTYPVGEGDVAVVQAAAGGVGLLLTQMVTMRAGVVVATTSTHGKADLARAAGAAHLATYDNFGDIVRDVTGAEARPSSTTAWARRPSRQASPHCGLAGTWCCTERRAAGCHRSTCSGWRRRDHSS
jgi:NADPH2:quinone reductase